MKGDKAAPAAKSRPKWRDYMKGDKAAAAANGDQEGRQMKGDKAAAASLRSKNPYSFQLSGE